MDTDYFEGIYFIFLLIPFAILLLVRLYKNLTPTKHTAFPGSKILRNFMVIGAAILLFAFITFLLREVIIS